MAKAVKVASPAKKAATKKAPAAPPAKEKPAAKKAAKKSAPKKKAEGGFMAALTPSPTLAAVIGKKALPRTEIIKAIWVYIKKNSLQDATNKRMINADAKLKPLFGKDQVSMFDLAKIISSHVG